MDQFKADFIYFRNECIELTNLVSTFERLFHCDYLTRQLLLGVAGHFFSDLNIWMNEAFHLRVGRLTDGATFKGRNNLSVSFLLGGLKEFDVLSPEASVLGDKLNHFGSSIKDARHKRVAHVDLEATRNPEAIGSMRREQLRDFMNNLNEFTDVVGCLIGIGPLDYRFTSGPGDVDDLLLALRKVDAQTRSKTGINELLRD